MAMPPGLEWIREAGLLTSPIAFTNTHSIGVVRDSLIALEREAPARRQDVVLEHAGGAGNL